MKWITSAWMNLTSNDFCPLVWNFHQNIKSLSVTLYYLCPFWWNSTDHFDPFGKVIFLKRKFTFKNKIAKMPCILTIFVLFHSSKVWIYQVFVTHNEKLQFRLNKMLIQNNVICYHIIIRLLHFQAWISCCILNHCCV